MWRIPSERIRLGLDGPSVEVEPIRSDLIQFEGFRLLSAFVAASTPEATYATLIPLYDYFIAEAQPQWDIVDHRGPIPTSSRGMVRLGSDIAVGIISHWLQSLPDAAAGIAPEPEPDEPPSVVDSVIPKGPMNREIKRALRVAKQQQQTIDAEEAAELVAA